MTELLHMENRENAEKVAARVAEQLKIILADPILALEASMAGTKLSEFPR